MKNYLIVLSLFITVFSVAQVDTNVKPVDHIITNDPALPELLTEFYNSAIYYRVDYAPQLISLQKVVLIEADMNFIGGVVEIEGGQEVWLNSKLLLYPNLMRAIFYRQMGILYGLKPDKNSSNLDFMSDRWEMGPKYEHWAYNRRQNSTQKRIFFEKLAKKHPLVKQL
ncbi:MAG: hypothetical protein JJE07_07195 [Flavobacteriaceae bacterium]|nr:hypothetical protein [Flavobacteriaceae bacterium]